MISVQAGVLMINDAKQNERLNQLEVTKVSYFERKVFKVTCHTNPREMWRRS